MNLINQPSASLLISFYTNFTLHLFCKSLHEGGLSISFTLFGSQEALFIFIKGWKYFYKVEGWVTIITVIATFLVLANDSGNFEHRLVCAVALLFSWMEITMLLSRFPEFGNYFQMFFTVVLRVIKVIKEALAVVFKVGNTFTNYKNRYYNDFILRYFAFHGNILF